MDCRWKALWKAKISRNVALKRENLRSGCPVKVRYKTVVRQQDFGQRNNNLSASY